MKQSTSKSYSYVVFAGNDRGNLQPTKAAPTKQAAIKEAQQLQGTYRCVEAIYMPEHNVDINRIVYHHYEEV